MAAFDDFDALEDRNFRFAVRVIRLCAGLRRSPEGEIIGRQLIMAGTGIASNYRAARRSRSIAEFASRLATVEEEADESVLWLDLISAAEVSIIPEVQKLQHEARELRAIYARSRKTANTDNAFEKSFGLLCRIPQSLSGGGVQGLNVCPNVTDSHTGQVPYLCLQSWLAATGKYNPSFFYQFVSTFLVEPPMSACRRADSAGSKSSWWPLTSAAQIGNSVDAALVAHQIVTACRSLVLNTADSQSRPGDSLGRFWKARTHRNSGSKRFDETAHQKRRRQDTRRSPRVFSGATDQLLSSVPHQLTHSPTRQSNSPTRQFTHSPIA